MNASSYQKDLIKWLCSAYACIALFSNIFYSVIILGSTYETSRHLEVKIMIFSVSPLTYSVICSEKVCHIFEQILITCLKCSKASFSPSSHSKKMRWRRGSSCAFPQNLTTRKLGEFLVFYAVLVYILKSK